MITVNPETLENPNKYPAITLQNESYRIRIHYLQKNYKQHFRNKTLKPEDITIQIRTLNPKAPLLFAYLKTKQQQQVFAIETNPENTLIPAKDLEEYIKQLQLAKETLEDLKNCIRVYFGAYLLEDE